LVHFPKPGLKADLSRPLHFSGLKAAAPSVLAREC
jgi:hypothetical protein